jgi:polar amino acid transport system substrate-binding protein
MKVCKFPVFGVLFLFNVVSTAVYGACLPDGGAFQVSLGVSSTARPYVFPETDSGIEIDIVREALALQGYDLCPVYLPASRAAQRFAHGRLDGLLNVKTSLHGGFVSDSFITFQNCAFSLRDSGRKLTDIKDLAGRTVAAFQRAAILLEQEFALTIKEMLNYQEIYDQQVQLYLLLRERVDVIVLEERIFAYYHQRLLDQRENDATSIISAQIMNKTIQKSCMFEPSPYGIEFADKSIRDAFNAGFEALKASGRYDEIIESYLKLQMT